MMNKMFDILKNNIYKQSRIFRLSLYVMVILNVVYVSIVIYKSNIAAPFIGNPNIPAEEFEKIIRLTPYTSFLEVTFIALTIGLIVLVFTQKYKPYQSSYFVIQLVVLLALFLINEVLARLFNAPAGDMTLHVIGPFIILFFVSVYLMMKNTFFILMRKYRSSNS